MTVISIIAAAAECNGKKVIGKNSALPWHLPEDLRRFKQLTLNCPVIMGRKTYDSIGKPLPGRFNIIITRNAALQIGGAQTARSLDDAVNIAKAENPPEIFIIGGAQIYEQAMPIAARMYLTEINCEAEGDVFFPPFSKTEWAETSRKRGGAPLLNKNKTPEIKYDFAVYEKSK